MVVNEQQMLNIYSYFINQQIDYEDDEEDKLYILKISKDFIAICI